MRPILCCWVFLVSLSARVPAQAGCAPFGPSKIDGPWGAVVTTPLWAVPGNCPPPPGCNFGIYYEAFITQVPGSNPPQLPVPEPPILLDVTLNGVSIVQGAQVTTPPQPSPYYWSLFIQGPVPCGDEIRVETGVPAGGAGAIGLAFFGCSGC